MRRVELKDLKVGQQLKGMKSNQDLLNGKNGPKGTYRFVSSVLYAYLTIPHLFLKLVDKHNIYFLLLSQLYF